MKTIKEVKDKITTAFCNNDYIKQAYGLDENKTFNEQFSVVSFENILFDILAGVIFIVLRFFRQNQSEVTNKINTLVPHTLAWYRTKALLFQYGFDLLPDSDKFDNGDATDEAIQDSKIIKQCSVNESDDGRLIVKVAKEVDNEFEALEPQELTNLNTYLQDVKDAGVRLDVISLLPDKLKIGLTIRYNPLLLDENGVCLRTGKEPVKDAIKSYLKQLPFDGELSLMKMIDAIQEVEGVEDLKLTNALTAWINGTSYEPYEVINMSVVPKSGWFKEEIDPVYEIAE